MINFTTKLPYNVVLKESRIFGHAFEQVFGPVYLENGTCSRYFAYLPCQGAVWLTYYRVIPLRSENEVGVKIDCYQVMTSRQPIGKY